MAKGNRRFSWKEAQAEEYGFHTEAEGSSVNHQCQAEEPPLSDGNTRTGRTEDYRVDQFHRNDILNNRLQANDELYISPHEHAGMNLTSDLFDGKNFHSWTRAIRRGLFARNKLCFIDGTLSDPGEESVDHKQWIRTDYVIFNWICNSIVKEISRGLQGLESSRMLWLEINKRFGKRNGPRMYKLRRDIATVTQQGQSVMTYFNALSSLWDDLDLLLSSKKCVCEASVDAQIEHEEKRMMEFLMGLNDVYEPIRQQILIMCPLPTVSQAHGMVLQLEEQMQVSAALGSGVEHSALYNAYKGAGKGDGVFKRRLSKEEKSRLKCDHCGGKGHIKADCFELNGVPEWYKVYKTENKGTMRANFAEEQGQMGVKDSEGNQNGENGHQQGLDKFIQAEIAKQLAILARQTSRGDALGQTVNTANMIEVDFGSKMINPEFTRFLGSNHVCFACHLVTLVG